MSDFTISFIGSKYLTTTSRESKLLTRLINIIHSDRSTCVEFGNRLQRVQIRPTFTRTGVEKVSTRHRTRFRTGRSNWSGWLLTVKFYNTLDHFIYSEF